MEHRPSSHRSPSYRYVWSWRLWIDSVVTLVDDRRGVTGCATLQVFCDRQSLWLRPLWALRCARWCLCPKIVLWGKKLNKTFMNSNWMLWSHLMNSACKLQYCRCLARARLRLTSQLISSSSFTIQCENMLRLLGDVSFDANYSRHFAEFMWIRWSGGLSCDWWVISFLSGVIISRKVDLFEIVTDKCWFAFFVCAG